MIGLSNNPVLKYQETGSNTKIVWGVIDKVYPETQQMVVMIPEGGTNKPVTVWINNMITDQGVGIRQMPRAGITSAVLYRDADGQYYHIGYYLKQVGLSTMDRFGDKDQTPTMLLHRYLEEGEVQIEGSLGNEILMSLDGSVLIKDSFGSYIRLESFTSTLKGSFSNLHYEMDGVRIRSGNIRRSTKKNTTEDQFILSVEDEVKGEDELEEDEEGSFIKEFMVKVGTVPDIYNYYRDDEYSGPKVTFYLGDKFIREDGSELMAAGKSLTCVLQTKTDDGYPGSGYAIDESGAFFIMDWKSFNSTKFGVGGEGVTPQKVFRVGSNMVSIDSEGILVQHEKNAYIEINKNGDLRMQDHAGRYISIDNQGIKLDAFQSPILLKGKSISILTTKMSMGLFGVDVPLKATGFAVYYDTHIHLGPNGPVAVPITPFIPIPQSPLATQGFMVT